MMKVNFIKQTSATQGGFGFSINIYDVIGSYKFVDLLQMEELFDVDIQLPQVREDIKMKGKKSLYLRGLFNSKKLSIKDFKLIQDKGIYYYLEGFSDSEEEWGKDKIIFKSLLSKFTDITKDSLSECYLINKEWFNANSNKVKAREFALYDFYFIILWIDKKDNSKLYISEWFSD